MRWTGLRAEIPAPFLFSMVLLLLFPAPAWSCSMCRCGDPTFNALGTEIYSPGAFRLAVDWDRMEKSEGPPGESESQVTNTVTATMSYSFGDRLVEHAQPGTGSTDPFAVLDLNYRWAGEDTVDASGEKDPDTGGSLLYVTPRVLVNLGGDFVARASVLIPTFKSLNGYQTEKAIVSAGLTYTF